MFTYIVDIHILEACILQPEVNEGIRSIFDILLRDVACKVIPRPMKRA
jgi:hypothetical protein